MTTDYMENMAREYNSLLKNESATALAENAVAVEEAALSLLENALPRTRTNALPYVISLKREVLKMLYALMGDSGIAEPQTAINRVPFTVGKRLIDLQVELFVILDKLRAKGTNVDKLLELETRAATFISSLF